MIGLSRNLKAKQITVKIENMKRRNYGDSPPLSRKKRHSSINRYDISSDERGSPERDRERERARRRARSPPSPRTSRYSERDEFGRSRGTDRSHPTYKVLSVSALHTKASDEHIKDTLYREYRKFGEFSVRISHELDERIAYVCFRNSEDARDAKHSKPRISLFDKIALVAPVYESRSSRHHYEVRSRRSRSQSFSPEYERYYHRSPIPPEIHHRPYPSERFFERLPYGLLPPLLPPRDFREIGLPQLHPHELMIPRGPILHHVTPLHPHLTPLHPLYGPPRHFLPPFRPLPSHHHSIDRLDRIDRLERIERIERIDRIDRIDRNERNERIDRIDRNDRNVHDKKDKFPNYLHHIPPEEDPLATRTLFAGNLEISISDEELHRIFGRYGIVEDIDVKRPLPGTGNAYAFVRYKNLDMAHRAKIELSGQYLGKFQCKIGYGKSTPTQRIWIGGLGPWISLAQLEREFDRFGVIKKIEYLKGDLCAYIQFESIDAATAAVKEMRGVCLGGSEHKLRTDFADGGMCSSPTLTYSSKSKSSHEDTPVNITDFQELPRREEYPYGWLEGEFPSFSSRNYKVRPEYVEENRDVCNYDNGHSFKPHSVSDIGSPRSPGRSPVPRSPGRSPVPRSPLHQTIDSDIELEVLQPVTPLSSVYTLSELAYKCNDTWQGSLILKSSQFPAKCHLTSGDPSLIEAMMKDSSSDGKFTLRITQRLRLDEPKLKDVSHRIMTADMHAIFVAMPLAVNENPDNEEEDALIQIRPLRNLVSYLKQKEAAGVISLLGKDSETIGVLYAFPPCAFSASLLRQSANNLSDETLKDDHLVIVIVNGD
ncbi:SPOC-like, C-terminal domain,Spen paralogue/orthologue C-terminal, metazoa,Spen paralogue [Cinara cedri]|uniref:SPOC-like, C-terminal domain,Spen paralogue/orthologue C-terminal, metazoa,Spen paralogue n=1 Tax=Cinara cedri TaxID=506608 RepID=A0A5E4N1J3_9HEMI|nr:SPOC-like, C-terminal domain,Spen paralogue/orthologue C-terminal, metazoa,Spen paralogue [Cinara cedri]